MSTPRAWTATLLTALLLALPTAGAGATQAPLTGLGRSVLRERRLEGGRRVFSQTTDDVDLVRHQVFEGERCVGTLYVHRIGQREMQLLDGDRDLLVRALRRPDGRIEVRDASGLLLSSVRGDRAERMAQAVAAGRSVGETVYATLTTTKSSVAEGQHRTL
jgi:hypothetical protein